MDANPRTETLVCGVDDSAHAAVLDEGADLAVIGSRRLGPVRAALFGSVSSRLAARSPVPVMIVPATDATSAATAL